MPPLLLQDMLQKSIILPTVVAEAASTKDTSTPRDTSQRHIGIPMVIERTLKYTDTAPRLTILNQITTIEADTAYPDIDITDPFRLIKYLKKGHKKKLQNIKHLFHS